MQLMYTDTFYSKHKAEGEGGNNLQRIKAVGADDVFPARLTSLSKQRKSITSPRASF